MKINNYWGDLTDIPAKKEPLHMRTLRRPLECEILKIWGLCLAQSSSCIGFFNNTVSSETYKVDASVESP